MNRLHSINKYHRQKKYAEDMLSDARFTQTFSANIGLLREKLGEQIYVT
jgi:hypothetical protein